MIAQFTLVPIGQSESLSGLLADAMRPVVDSGLDYRVGPMGTTVEGTWSQIMSLIDQCRKILLQKSGRVQILIHVDDRKNAQGRIKGKVKSLEKKMGRKIKK